jgi:hypothetical protein
MPRSSRLAAIFGLLACACAAPPITADTETSDPTQAATTEPTTGPTGEPAWAVWTRHPERHFRGQIFDGDLFLASDPCVLKDGATYHMFYTCVAGAAVGGLCHVQSSDGVDWQPATSIDPAIDGLVVRARPGEGWDENMETCAVLREADGISLYYSGYPALDPEGQRGPAALGRLRSADGVAFNRDPDAPILEPIPGDRDGDDIFSAVMLADGDNLDAVYVGWCVDGYHDGQACTHGPAIQLLGATRNAEGVWTRNAEPVLGPGPDPAWLQEGVAEPDLLRGPDGQYYLFVSGALGDDEPRVTGLAVGPSPFGPWTLNPEPILQGAPGAFDTCGAFAPSVLLDGDRVRMWYLGLDDCAGACPGCNHAACGCEARFSIGYAEATWPLWSP